MPETTTTTKPESIVLGSGTAYLMNVKDAGSLDDFDALITKVCTEDHKLGSTKNGATLTYTTTNYTASSDLGDVKKTVLQAESAALALGIITIGPKLLLYVIETADTRQTDGGLTVVSIGGVGNADGNEYILIFHHEDKLDGDIYVAICGKNTAELSLAFSQENETIVNPTFTANPKKINSRDGVLIQIAFADPKSSTGQEGQ